MELVRGTTLQDRLGRGPLAPVEAARIGRQVLSALRAAHAAGIQHRDVKPANVLLRDGPGGGAVLTDFGIAALQGSASLTATGELIGSPEYIAPERIRGRDDDPASDLWSLGLVLYVSVEGLSPLRRGTTLATLAAVLDEDVPPPVRSGPLAPVLRALLVRDPAGRPDARQLDAMLAQVESGMLPHWAGPTMTATAPPPVMPGPVPPVPTQLDSPRPTVPQPPPLPDRTSSKPRGAVVAAVIAVAVAITAATALVLVLRDQGKDNAGGRGGPTGSTASTPAATTSDPRPTPSPSPTRSPPRRRPRPLRRRAAPTSPRTRPVRRPPAAGSPSSTPSPSAPAPPHVTYASRRSAPPCPRPSSSAATTTPRCARGSGSSTHPAPSRTAGRHWPSAPNAAGRRRAPASGAI